MQKTAESILRFIQEDSEGNAVLKYQGAEYEDSNHNNEIISLPNKTKDRLKYNKLYIEKTVDAHTDDIVEANDDITYTIVVKNNSEKKYTENIIVTENISDYVTYKNFQV
ncbi:MAG: hypothetical protein IJT65_00940, partial [Eubacterium sp.]|nr:hypothetical protein [Eubacterium sp.]